MALLDKDSALFDIYLISPALFILLTAVLILFIKLFFKNDEPPKLFVSAFTALGLIVSFYLSTHIFNFLAGSKALAFEESLVFEPFSYWTGWALFSSALMSLCLFHKSKNVTKHRYTEFLFLFLSSVAGSLVILWSHNLLVLFVGMELMTLPLYTMVLLTRKQGYTIESAVKYYILGSVASAFFLLGLVLVYGASASQFGDEVLLNITKLGEASATLAQVDHLFLIGSTLMLLSALLKVGLFPFHNWVPDVYQGANSSVTYYMLTLVKISAVVVVVKLFAAGFLVHAEFFKFALQWLVVLSMVFGAVFAMAQTNIKRMLAYSGVAQSGYMLMSILGYGFDGAGTVDALVFYFFPYLFFSGVIFLMVQFLESIKGADLCLIDLTGLCHRKPLESLCILIGVFGLSGVPPFVGFMTKFYVLHEAVQTGFYWVAFWALFAAGLSMVYYLRVVSRIYFYPYDKELHVLWARPLAKTGSYKARAILMTAALLVFSVMFIYYFPVNL